MNEKLNYWHMTCIWSASLGFPAILIGRQLAQQYGVGSVILSLGIANLGLWLLSIAIISMMVNKSGDITSRMSAIENVEHYLGSTSSVVASVCLIIIEVTWFAIQIELSVEAIKFLCRYVDWCNNYFEFFLIIFIGVSISLCARKGVFFIKKVCLYGFPFFIGFIALLCIFGDTPDFFETIWKPSLPAVTTGMAIMLAGIVNMPTVYRHIASRADAYYSLTFITIFTFAFECSSIFIGIGEPIEIFSVKMQPMLYFFQIFITIIFVLWALLSVNLVNIYLASAGWKKIQKKIKSISKIQLSDATIYFWTGILGTIVVFMIKYSFFLYLLMKAIGSSIPILVVVLPTMFLFRRVFRHRENASRRYVANFSWAIGSFFAGYNILRGVEMSDAIPLGCIATIVVGIFIAFYEETQWSRKELTKEEKAK